MSAVNTSASPPLPLAKTQLGMRFSIIEGCICQMFYGMTWPASVFITGLALMLGANNFEIGILAAIAPLLSGVYLIAAPMLEKSGNRKKFLITYSLPHRAVYFVLFFLPLIAHALPERLRVGALIAVVFVSIFLGNLQNAAWMSWMGDLVPENRRGAFFSRRNMICGGLWMGQAYLIGVYLDHNKTLMGYGMAFGVSAFVALFALLVTAKMPEPAFAKSIEKPQLWKLWKEAYASPSFRNFLFFQIAWGFTTNLAGPFYNVFMLQELHLDMARITLWGILGGLVGTVTMPYWGTLSDRAGNKATLTLCLIGSCIVAFGWLFVNPHTMNWLIVTLFAVGSFFDWGIGLIAFNMIFGILPEKNKPTYLGIYETVVGTLMGIAPALGGWLAVTLPKTEIPHIPTDSVMVVIGISTVLRLFPLIFLRAMPSPNSRGVGFLVKEFVLANPFKLFTSLYLGSKSADEKLEAIDTLSQMKTKAATPELIRSMRDLNPRVRLRSVRALGEIGDTQALPSLMEVLNDPLEDLQVEAILAMGKIGDPRAIPVLLQKLDSTDQHLQRSAALALGDLKAKEAVGPLIKLVMSTDRNMVLVACADALGRIREYRAVEPLLEITRASRNTAIKHSLVASAGMLIDQEGDLYKTLSSPESHSITAAEEILNPRTIRLARATQNQLRKNLADALAAFRRQAYNEAIVEMKMVNQITVREFLARKELKDAMGFEDWVKLLDSNYGIQLEAVQRIHSPTGIALAMVDYYARHCPVPAEPDMDQQEFLLALYAFRESQAGLQRLEFGRNVLQEVLLERLEGVRGIFDVT